MNIDTVMLILLMVAILSTAVCAWMFYLVRQPFQLGCLMVASSGVVVCLLSWQSIQYNERLTQTVLDGRFYETTRTTSAMTTTQPRSWCIYVVVQDSRTGRDVAIGCDSVCYVYEHGKAWEDMEKVSCAPYIDPRDGSIRSPK